MKNSILFLFIFGGTIALSMVLPWWILGPLALALCYIAKPKLGAAFLISFGAVFIAWLLSIYFVDDGSVSVLLGKLLGIEAYFTPIVSGLIGGLLGGLFGLAGALLRPSTSTAPTDIAVESTT